MAILFWVGGAGTWDNASTTHWSTSTGGAAGAGPPAAADTVTFDASSGGGTVTIAATINGTNTVASIVSGVFTGTIDANANTPTVTLATFNNAGAGVRTVTLGASVWNVTGTSGTVWDFSGSNLTLTANTATINVSATLTAGRVVTMGTGKTYGGTLSITDGQTTGSTLFNTTLASGFTITNLTYSAPNFIILGTAITVTVTGTFSCSGTQINQIVLIGNGNGATLAPPAATTMNWVATAALTYTGSPTANNSVGSGSGITINPPTAGGGAHIIGG